MYAVLLQEASWPLTGALLTESIVPPRMALREWWTRLGLQSRSTNRQWRCRVSAPPPVSSWPVVQTGKDGCRLGLFRRPRRLRFPNKDFIVHLWPVRIAVAVTLLESSDLQSLEVFSERVANQRRAIPLGTMRGPVGRLSELRIANNLDRFHMWNLLHSILHNQGTGGFVPAIRPASGSRFHPWPRISPVTRGPRQRRGFRRPACFISVSSPCNPMSVAGPRSSRAGRIRRLERELHIAPLLPCAVCNCYRVKMKTIGMEMIQCKLKQV